MAGPRAGCVDVVYQVGTRYSEEHLSRWYPRGGLGHCAFSRRLRGALCRDYMRDVDMENAQPRLLLGMGQRRSWVHKQLAAYVRNRAAVLAEIMATNECDAEAAKKRVTALFFGGADVSGLPPSVAALHAERCVP